MVKWVVSSANRSATWRQEEPSCTVWTGHDVGTDVTIVIMEAYSMVNSPP